MTNKDTRTVGISFLKLGVPVMNCRKSVVPTVMTKCLVSEVRGRLQGIIPRVVSLVMAPFMALAMAVFLVLFVLNPVARAFRVTIDSFVIVLVGTPLNVKCVLFNTLRRLLIVANLRRALSVVRLRLLTSANRGILGPLVATDVTKRLKTTVDTTLLVGIGLGEAGTVSSSASALFKVARPLLFNIGLEDLEVLISNVLKKTINNLLACVFNLSTANVKVAFVPKLLLCADDFTSVVRCLIIVMKTFIAKFVTIGMRSGGVSRRLGLSWLGGREKR